MNDKYTEDSQYKNGIGFFLRMRSVIKEERRFCERCGKDLKGVGRYLWAVHHKDHNHYNNILENFELLCKGCHQKEHQCARELNKKVWERNCWFCGCTFKTKTFNREFCDSCKKLWRSKYKGRVSREGARPLILAEKCNDYSERK